MTGRWRVFHPLLAATVVASAGGALQDVEGISGDTELGRLLASLPDKGDDVHTVTRRFRQDLALHCIGRGQCRDLTVVELGCHIGHTTSVLAQLFSRVFVLDNNLTGLAEAKARCRGNKNVVYLRMEHYNAVQPFEWQVLVEANDVDAVFIDASHFYEHVITDIRAALELPTVRMLVFDDYGMLVPVRQAVDAYIRTGVLRCEAIGETLATLRQLDAAEKAMTFWGTGGRRDELNQEEEDFLSSWILDGVPREGLICEVVRPVAGIRAIDSIDWLRAVVDQPFTCHRIAMLKGSAHLALEFVIIVHSNGKLRAETLDPLAPVLHFDWQVSSAGPLQISLSNSVPPLRQEFLFSSRLRIGYFLEDGFPDVFCIQSSDLTRLAQRSVLNLPGSPPSEI